MRASVRTGLLIGIAAATLVAARAGAAQRESPEELPPPESVEDIQPPLEEQVKEAKGETADDDPSILGSVGDELRRLPPFGEGASLRLTLRSYYMYGKLKTNNRREAWVYGGSVLYQTPQLGDRLALGAEFFVSQPIHAPSNRDGTLLLRRRQRQYAVFGQTYAKLELADDHVATLYRQTYDLPYLNKEYNRMTPTTFEGYTVQGGFGGDDADELLYIAGYVSKIKTRNSDRFIPMGARAAPAAEPKRGTWMAGATYQPTDRISIGAIDYYTRDVLNLFYAQAAGTWSLRDGLPVRALLQFTDQRSVNDDLITGSSFDTRSLVGQVAAKMMRQGAIVYPEQIKSPRMVRRGQIITVRCIFGGLEVKTIARAREDGAAGDIIQVRNERSRDDYPVKVTAMGHAVALLAEPGHLAQGDLR